MAFLLHDLLNYNKFHHYHTLKLLRIKKYFIQYHPPYLSYLYMFPSFALKPDLSGKIVYTKMHIDSEQISVIDIQSLPAGFYSVEVNSNNFHGFQKLSVLR